jgi:hypothetical protein
MPSFGGYLAGQKARSEAQSARRGAVGKTLQKGVAAAREKAKMMRYQGRLMRLIEQMNLNRVVQPGELIAARDLGSYLKMTPKEVAETLHKIYTDRRRKAEFQQRMKAYPQIQNQQQFHGLANYFAGIAVQTGVVKLD